MSIVQPIWIENPVAANVRAELARHGLNANRLPALLGSTQAYWSRRTRGEVAFDANDLTALAELMQIDPGAFFAGAVDNWRARRDSNPQPAVWRSDGLADVVELTWATPADEPEADTAGPLAEVLVLRRAEQ